MGAAKASFGTTRVFQILILCLLGLAHGADARRRRRILQSRISAGYDTFYGVANNGSLYYWGINPQSKGATALAPTQFGAPNQTWNQVGSGVRFGCGIPLNGGRPQCWGGAEEDAVRSVSEVAEELTQLCVGVYHACGVSKTGSIVCWGGGARTNALGSGSNDTSIYKAIVNGTDWASVSCGNGFTFGLKQDGSLYGWGSNGNHEVSPSNETIILQPYQVPGTWLSVSAGSAYTLAIDSTNAAYGWGLAEKIDVDFADGGSLGDGSAMCYDPVSEKFCDRSATDPTNAPGDGDYFDYGYDTFSKSVADPVPVTGGLKFESISAGGGLSCGIEQGTKNAYCWGYTTGEAFVQGSPQSNAPKLLDNSTWAAIIVGNSDTRCGTKTDGTLWCWGRNDFNCDSDCPLGDGTVNNSAVPVKVINVENWLPTAPAPIPAPVPAPVPAPEPAIAPAPAPTPIFSPPQNVSPENIAPPPPPMSSAESIRNSFGTLVVAGVVAVALL